MAPFRGSILSPYDPKITSKTSILDFKGVDSSEREDLFGLGEVSKDSNTSGMRFKVPGSGKNGHRRVFFISESKESP